MTNTPPPTTNTAGRDRKKRYSGLAYTSPPATRSLFAKLVYVLSFLTLTMTMFAGVLTTIVHRVTLEPLVPPEMLSLVRENLVVGLSLVALLSLALAIATAALLAQQLTQPINQLMQAMKRVAHDDLSVRIASHRRDEFGVLANFFNSMVKTISAVQQRNANVQKLKSQFVSAAAHQLRTPLTGLKWSLQYVLEEKAGTITAEQRQTLAQGQATAEKMMHIVNQFLNVAKIEEGKSGLNLQTVAIAPLVKKAVSAHEDEARRRELTLRWQSKLDDQVTIVGDPAHLEMVVTNLLDNALTYTPAGGTVTVGLEPSKNHVTISVQDTGIGISPAEKKHIFRQFYRGENAKKVHTDGSGLGLFIAQNIVRQHSGRLWFESAGKQSTTFYVTLPVHEELLPKPASLEEFLQEI